MTYTRFEELPVSQEAVRLAEGVFDMTEDARWKASRSLRDQLERAALSVSNNIAEGCERGSTNELLAFIYIARGSAGEVRSMLCFLERRRACGDLKSSAESCSRQLRAWAEYSQNSETQGQRHLTDQARKRFDSKKKSEDFRQELKANLPPGHPLRKQP